MNLTSLYVAKLAYELKNTRHMLTAKNGLEIKNRIQIKSLIKIGF